MRFDGIQKAGQEDGSTHNAGAPARKPKVIGQVKQGESLFTVDKKDKNGYIQSQSTYLDRNGDNIITEDELYVVDSYKFNGKGWSIERFTDIDGDGYNDVTELYDYDQNNNLKHCDRRKEEDINNVDSDAEILNRQMVNHQAGLYINDRDGTKSPQQNSNQQTEQLKVISSAVTKKYGNEFTALEDKDGNTVLRVDYGNNEPNNFFDEEEVRSPDGKLISYTTQAHSDGEKTERWFKTVYFDNNGEISRIEEKTYVNGKLTNTENIPIEKDTVLVASVQIKIAHSSDGWQEPELQKLVQEHGGQVIGKNY